MTEINDYIEKKYDYYWANVLRLKSLQFIKLSINFLKLSRSAISLCMCKIDKLFNLRAHNVERKYVFNLLNAEKECSQVQVDTGIVNTSFINLTSSGKSVAVCGCFLRKIMTSFTFCGLVSIISINISSMRALMMHRTLLQRER